FEKRSKICDFRYRYVSVSTGPGSDSVRRSRRPNQTSGCKIRASNAMAPRSQSVFSRTAWFGIVHRRDNFSGVPQSDAAVESDQRTTPISDCGQEPRSPLPKYDKVQSPASDVEQNRLQRALLTLGDELAPRVCGQELAFATLYQTGLLHGRVDEEQWH